MRLTQEQLVVLLLVLLLPQLEVVVVGHVLFIPPPGRNLLRSLGDLSVTTPDLVANDEEAAVSGKHHLVVVDHDAQSVQRENDRRGEGNQDQSLNKEPVHGRFQSFFADQEPCDITPLALVDRSESENHHDSSNIRELLQLLRHIQMNSLHVVLIETNDGLGIRNYLGEEVLFGRWCDLNLLLHKLIFGGRALPPDAGQSHRLLLFRDGFLDWHGCESVRLSDADLRRLGLGEDDRSHVVRVYGSRNKCCCLGKTLVRGANHYLLLALLRKLLRELRD